MNNKAEQKYTESIIATVHEPLVILNSDLRIISANRSFYNTFKVNPQETEQKLIYNLGNKQWNIPKLQKLLEKILSTKTPIEDCEVEHLFETIGQKTMLINARKIIKEEEELILLAIEDITERKQTEEKFKKYSDNLEALVNERTAKLKNSKEQFTSIISNIPGIVYRCALDKKWTMEFLSEYTVDLTGFPVSDFIGNSVRTYESIIHSEDAEYVKQSVHKAVESDKAWEIEYRINHKDGSIRWVLENGNVVYDPAGKFQFLQGVILDITDSKKYEELSIQTQKIESIGILAGGIAHDFNNILMGILGNISLAKIKFPKAHPGYKYLEESEQSIYRATNLANKLLTFSSGGTPIKENIILGKLIEEVVRFDLTGSNVRLYFKQAKELCLANIDKTQIQQVFSNLTINANQAMPNGGILYITLENADIKENIVQGLKQGKYIKATVQDEGIGIDYKNHDYVFHPFFSTKEIGRGLGLPIVYSIIKKHGGFISFDSELGKGTTFTLYIPTSETQLHPKAKQSDVTEYSKNEQISRILVMDDEEQIYNFLEKILEEYGFSVSTATEGKQAIEIYKQSLDNGKPYDAVILDLTMPGGIGGKEVVKELLKVDPDAKCIISSGYANDPVIANHREYGFKGILTKPYTPNKLLEVLNTVLKE